MPSDETPERAESNGPVPVETERGDPGRALVDVQVGVDVVHDERLDGLEESARATRGEPEGTHGGQAHVQVRRGTSARGHERRRIVSALEDVQRGVEVVGAEGVGRREEHVRAVVAGGEEDRRDRVAAGSTARRHQLRGG